MFFRKLESIPCCPTLMVATSMCHACMVLSSSTRKAQLITIKVPKYHADITIDMQFIKFVPGSEESQQEYYYKRIAAKEQW